MLRPVSGNPGPVPYSNLVWWLRNHCERTVRKLIALQVTTDSLGTRISLRLLNLIPVVVNDDR